MYYRRSIDFAEILPLVLGILIGICIVVCLLSFFIMRTIEKEDSKKELITRKVKIIEKPVQQGKIEWYVVECDNGERLKLRSFKGNTMLISVGDTGTVQYRGKTIQSFHRQ